jgi:hypothetical protein
LEIRKKGLLAISRSLLKRPLQAESQEKGITQEDSWKLDEAVR